jgi:hypothetical protein
MFNIPHTEHHMCLNHIKLAQPQDLQPASPYTKNDNQLADRLDRHRLLSSIPTPLPPPNFPGTAGGILDPIPMMDIYSSV